MSAASGRTVKSVHLIPKDDAIKRLCFDDQTQKLRPNLTLVDARGAVVFEINELGLKGAPRDPSRKLGVVWGDSVVFGVRWSWPCLIDELAPGWQFLNGGIEGDPYENVLRRVTAFNRQYEVALNVVMLGWHPLGIPAQLAARPATRLQRLWQRIGMAAPAELKLDRTNQRIGDDLTAFLGTTPNTVLATMPTPLNSNIVGRDLSPYFTTGNRETVFQFTGPLRYSQEIQRHLFEHITERNTIVREAAQATGTRLIDLAAIFETHRLDDFRNDFFDMLHLRPRVYPRTARAVYDAIRDLL